MEESIRTCINILSLLVSMVHYRHRQLQESGSQSSVQDKLIIQSQTIRAKLHQDLNKIMHIRLCMYYDLKELLVSYFRSRFHHNRLHGFFK